MAFGTIRIQHFGRAAQLWVLAGLMLSGCAGAPAMPEAAAPAEVAVPAGTAAMPAPDPLAAFVATAAPGTEARLPLPGSGQSARVRLLRAYHAASGRECREVLIGSGLDERSSLVCRENGAWAAVRPLLRGSGS